MNPALREAMETALARALGEERTSIHRVEGIGGSLAHQTSRAVLADGRRLVLKVHGNPPPAFFAAEAAGLEALRRAGTLRVPAWAVSGDGPGGSFLLLEEIPSGPARPETWPRFGRRFARLHRENRAPRCGFDGDNYLGATHQPNGWMDSWPEFWRQRRLGHQLSLARREGRSDPEIDRLGDRLIDRLETWIGPLAEGASLLHGDLWSGNALIDEAGEPAVIDPAVYYGDREADLAMTRLFGGFPEAFYRAYEEEWPLEPGWRERLDLYQLYHLLNHLNLFGAGYRAGCLAVLRRYG